MRMAAVTAVVRSLESSFLWSESIEPVFFCRATPVNPFLRTSLLEKAYRLKRASTKGKFATKARRSELFSSYHAGIKHISADDGRQAMTG
jgi:hypothetical protein